MSKLPIELVPNTTPPRFRWEQLVDSINGMKKVTYEDAVRASFEKPLVELINMANLLTERLGLAGGKLEKAMKFKAWVHAYLDAHNVPKEFPNGTHTKEGCRIGDRMDWLLKELTDARKRCDELAKQLEAKPVEKKKG